MLRIDPNERLSAIECLAHAFFSRGGALTKEQQLRNSKSTEKT